MVTKFNKGKIILFILESEGKCSESVYFKILRRDKRDDLKYDIIVVNIGTNYSDTKILQIKNTKNIKKIILVKDNDLIKDYTNKNILQDSIRIKKILLNNKVINFKKISIERYGIPEENKTFDSFLLAHFSSDIFEKNDKSKKEIIKSLENKLGENFKGDEKKIVKVFVKDYLKNLKINIENFDNQYKELINLLFEYKN